MNTKEQRWVQRFQHFKKALNQLSKFIEKPFLNELEEQGLIKAFEYTYELGWNTLKDYLESQGETDIFGSRDAIRLAFRRGLVANGDLWMQMLKSRTLTVHTYNEQVAEDIVNDIKQKYYSEFLELEKKFTQILSRQE